MSHTHSRNPGRDSQQWNTRTEKHIQSLNQKKRFQSTFCLVPSFLSPIHVPIAALANPLWLHGFTELLSGVFKRYLQQASHSEGREGNMPDPPVWIPTACTGTQMFAGQAASLALLCTDPLCITCVINGMQRLGAWIQLCDGKQVEGFFLENGPCKHWAFGMGPPAPHGNRGMAVTDQRQQSLQRSEKMVLLVKHCSPLGGSADFYTGETVLGWETSPAAPMWSWLEGHEGQKRAMLDSVNLHRTWFRKLHGCNLYAPLPHCSARPRSTDFIFWKVSSPGKAAVK